jgi:hypothetical protein
VIAATADAATVTNAQVAFTLPTELTGGQIDVAGRNTTVVVTSVQNQGFIDVDPFNDGVTVKYRRTAVYEGVSSTVGEFSITAWAPWFVAHSEDKKRVRLNIISHLLAHIPYEALPAEPVKLPKRKIGKVKPSDHPLRIVPALF